MSGNQTIIVGGSRYSLENSDSLHVTVTDGKTNQTLTWKALLSEGVKMNMERHAGEGATLISLSFVATDITIKEPA